MERLGERDRVLLGYAYRDPFGNLQQPPPPQPHHRNSDVDFADEALLEDISFGDLFLGIDHGDVLPDLELDPAEIFAEFSVGEEHSGSTTAWEAAEGMLGVDGASQDVVVAALEEHNGGRGEEVVSAMTREESMVMPSRARPSSPDGNKGRTPSAAAAAKGSHRKRKAKVGYPCYQP